MSKIIDIILNSLLAVLVLFNFSDGIIYFIKIINKDGSIFPNIVLMISVIYLIIFVEQYRILRKLCKNYKNEE